HCALTLPGMGRPTTEPMSSAEVRQVPEIDLDFDLTGCEATWTPANGGASWTGWLPHPDLKVSRVLTAGGAAHEALLTGMEQPGELTLRTQLDLANMLQPAVQPGSRLDFDYPPEVVTVTWESTAALQLVAPDGKTSADKSVSFTLQPTRHQPAVVELRL